jgi:hypothetical protein
VELRTTPSGSGDTILWDDRPIIYAAIGNLRCQFPDVHSKWSSSRHDNAVIDAFKDDPKFREALTAEIIKLRLEWS